MTEFLLIRHAVNDFVKTHRLAGWTPGVHLNEEGHAQAEALGQRLAKTRLDAIYSSPLERTMETAQAVLAHHTHLKLNTLEEVGEVRYGDWTGAELSKLSQRKMWRVIQFAPSRASFPNGETMREAQMRAVNALEKLVIKHPRERVAVVSHSDVIKMILAHYLGMHLDLFQRIEVSPASLSVISMSGGRPTVLLINETSYLPKPRKADPKLFREAYERNQPLQHILVDAVGQPGARTFYLQAAIKVEERDEFGLLNMEKTQAFALADQIDALLKQIAAEHPSLHPAIAVDSPTFQEPAQTFFRAGAFRLQYRVDLDLIDLGITELVGADQPKSDELHLWITRGQAHTLAVHARQVAQSGLGSQQ